MSATCFPCGSPEMVEEQLLELKDKTNGTLNGCIAYTEKQVWEALERESNQ